MSSQLSGSMSDRPRNRAPSDDPPYRVYRGDGSDDPPPRSARTTFTGPRPVGCCPACAATTAIPRCSWTSDPGRDGGPGGPAVRAGGAIAVPGPGCRGGGGGVQRAASAQVAGAGDRRLAGAVGRAVPRLRPDPERPIPKSAQNALHSGSNMITGTDTVLVLGTDQRPKGSKEPGAIRRRGIRSDSIMLWRIGGGTSRRLSIPRDTVANIPGHGQSQDQRRLRLRRPGAGDQDGRGSSPGSRSTT